MNNFLKKNINSLLMKCLVSIQKDKRVIQIHLGLMIKCGVKLMNSTNCLPSKELLVPSYTVQENGDPFLTVLNLSKKHCLQIGHRRLKVSL
jgi:hypothetical protein